MSVPDRASDGVGARTYVLVVVTEVVVIAALWLLQRVFGPA
jgi:hypothetical protein